MVNPRDIFFKNWKVKYKCTCINITKLFYSRSMKITQYKKLSDAQQTKVCQTLGIYSKTLFASLNDKIYTVFQRCKELYDKSKIWPP